MSLNIAIAGATGRMGRALIRAITEADDLTLVAGVERNDAPEIGAKLSTLGGAQRSAALVHADVKGAAQDADIWIDFTIPRASLAALKALKDAKTRAAIIGTTGFDAAGEAEIAAAAKRLAIVKSGNFSLGVNMLAALVREAAKRLGPEWDIEIVEAHHRRKIDAPSGTALLLGEAAAEARNTTLETQRIEPRDGVTGPRPEGIGFAVVRGGGIVGEHDVIFVAEEEYLKLSHVALDRALFARGALAAARWAADKPPGLYSMRDVLGL
ncbi:MAG: 4-hydroxy-tetrahydrodipicolinate reductase [Alphaproteobacteria bacterium]